ncbi:RNA polymerase III-inhibiting protein maf1 [Coemansia sp. RSA 1287]|nr:RNA polymerase III-inhibiting protein maf1 [Coemansia sp. RSA 1287]
MARNGASESGRDHEQDRTQERDGSWGRSRDRQHGHQNEPESVSREDRLRRDSPARNNRSEEHSGAHMPKRSREELPVSSTLEPPRQCLTTSSAVELRTKLPVEAPTVRGYSKAYEVADTLCPKTRHSTGAQADARTDKTAASQDQLVARARATGKVASAKGGKAAGTDKKLYRYLENKYQEELEEAKALTPEQSSLTNIASPFGPLTQPASRKMLFYLIATLNASFPDYDFSSLNADQFTKEPSPDYCLKSISTTLLNVGCPATLKTSRMWDSIDDVINIDECDVYSYMPDPESDPYEAEGPVWSFNYFFLNRNLKRIVFFTCRCISNLDELDNTSDQELVFGDLIDEPARPDLYPVPSYARKEMSIGGGLRL